MTIPEPLVPPGAIKTLRDASQMMRADHDEGHPRHEFWKSLAAVMDCWARMGGFDEQFLYRVGGPETIEAARLYLESRDAGH